MQGQGWRGLWKTRLYVCSALITGPDAAETSPAERGSGKENKERCEQRSAKALQDQRSEPHHVGRRSGLGVQPGRCPRQQKLQAEEARVVLMPLLGSPLVFPKTQGENNSLLKSTNLLVPSWGSLPHWARANKASVSSWSPGTGSQPWPRHLLPPRSLLSQPHPGTEVCPGSTAEALGLSQAAWEQVWWGCFSISSPTLLKLTAGKALLPSPVPGEAAPCARCLVRRAALGRNSCWGWLVHIL